MSTRIITLLLCMFIFLSAYVSPVFAQNEILTSSLLETGLAKESAKKNYQINRYGCNVEKIKSQIILDEVIKQKRVKALSEFLMKQGYQKSIGSAMIASVQCNGNHLNGVVVIIPFTQNGSTIVAQIAQWNGSWNTTEYDGAIAVIQDRQEWVYDYDELQHKIIPVKKSEWIKKNDAPFGYIQGFSLPLVKQDVSLVTEISQPYVDNGFQGIQLTGTTSCKTVDIQKTVYTLLGFVAYRFHQRKYWCYNGSTVSNVNIGVYLSDVDPNFYYKGIVNQWDILGQNSTFHDSMRQAQVDNCIVKYGCIGSSYPAIQIITYANGQYSYRTWD